MDAQGRVSQMWLAQKLKLLKGNRRADVTPSITESAELTIWPQENAEPSFPELYKQVRQERLTTQQEPKKDKKKARLPHWKRRGRAVGG